MSRTQPPTKLKGAHGFERERDLDAICPMRRLAHERPSAVLAEFSQRLVDMPPEHVLLMKKFQNDEQLKAELDAKLGDDKEAMLAHLWETHKHMFKPLEQDGRHDEAVKRWLDAVELPEKDAVTQSSV